jgi:hypothetical protein
MNCGEFELVVNELAAGRLWDVAKHQHGLTHANECARCGARLANERLLSFELVALARQERQVQAPVALKQELMAAFAAQHASPAAPAAQVITFPQRTRVPYWALAIAAVAIVALALIVPLRSWFGRAPLQASTAGVIPKSVQPPLPVVSPTVTPNVAVVTPKNKISPANNANAATLASARHRNAPRPRTERALDASQEVASNNEVTSGFIPLTYLNNATASDGGVMVRVSVSRDKLAALGLPLNLERSGETIKADIIVGDDGVARAIRLVQ